MQPSDIEKAVSEYDEMREDMAELKELRPDFEKCFETFADENHVLLNLEINSPDIYEWIKRTSEVFYAFGRGSK